MKIIRNIIRRITRREAKKHPAAFLAQARERQAQVRRNVQLQMWRASKCR